MRKLCKRSVNRMTGHAGLLWDPSPRTRIEGSCALKAPHGRVSVDTLSDIYIGQLFVDVSPTLLLYFRRSSVGLQVYLWVDRVSTDMSTNRVGRYDNSSTYRSTGQRHAWWTLLLRLSFLYFFRVFRVWLVSVWPVWQFVTNSRENACYRG